MDGFLSHPATCDRLRHVGSLSVVREATAEVGAIPWVGLVGDGHAFGLT